MQLARLRSESLEDMSDEDKDEHDGCVVCHEAAQTHAFVLCGHQCVC